MKRLVLSIVALGLAAAGGSGTLAKAEGSPRLEAFSPALALSNAAAFYALGPKPAATPAAEAAAQAIAASLQDVGVTNVALDAFEQPAPGGIKRFVNVLATLPAAEDAPTNTPLILLAAHYDTKTGISDDFAGANDSASGVGALMEIARVLLAHPLRHEVRLAFFDGEEAAVAYGPADGFHGSRHLAAQYVAAGDDQRLDAMILLDMVGDASFSLTLPPNSDPDLLKLALAAAEADGCRAAVRLVRYAIGDDHEAFRAIHVPALDLIDFEYGSAPRRNDYWHTPADTLDKLSADSLAAASRIALRVAEALDARLPPPPDPPRPFLATGLFTIALLLLLLGLLGCVVPALPGPPIAYAALLVLQCHPSHPYSVAFLVFAGILAVLVTVADIVAAPWLTQQAGGSKLGTWGSILGFVVGLFLPIPFGFLVGCLAGAFLGEILAGQLAARRAGGNVAPVSHPFRAALAAFAGFLLGTGLKLLLCFYFLLKGFAFWL